MNNLNHIKIYKHKSENLHTYTKYESLRLAQVSSD